MTLMKDMAQVYEDPLETARWATRIIWVIVLVVAAFFSWSWFAVLDEVAVGEGRVTPSSQAQVIQVVDGGVLQQLMVREGQPVEQGQVLAVINPIRFQAQYDQRATELAALQARVARLEAELAGQVEISFPPNRRLDFALMNRETNVLVARQTQFQNEFSNLTTLKQLAEQELALLEPLLARGATTEIELLRLRQRVAELTGQLRRLQDDYATRAREEYATTATEMEAVAQGMVELESRLNATVITSPVRGVVKTVEVSTVGAVVQPGERIIEITPTDDQLRIEARITPRDIAFIHQDQAATVKISAYDSSIYGSLPGKVVFISPDTVRDEVQRDLIYYPVYVTTENNYLETANGRQHLITPGMVATVEIRTGERTVFEYLVKPLNRAREALRER